ncbi:hypothetical protein PFZ55_23880 [Streptomyces sp. MS2A]|uniref:hypothetical protein n=1 Tax=Streptomyces sp. enrichment culture TaxID=1795815 RepID=UPI003F573069|nr:hypothetical protein [Streptomyces sp. MS2A]
MHTHRVPGRVASGTGDCPANRAGTQVSDYVADGTERTKSMEEHAHPTGWIEALGWFSLSVAFACALVILADLFLLGRRQHMWIMNLVYPVTALYWGPVALWFYFVHGRRTSERAVE